MKPVLFVSLKREHEALGDEVEQTGVVAFRQVGEARKVKKRFCKAEERMRQGSFASEGRTGRV